MKKIYLLLLAMVCLMGFGLSFNKVEAVAVDCTFSKVTAELTSADSGLYVMTAVNNNKEYYVPNSSESKANGALAAKEFEGSVIDNEMIWKFEYSNENWNIKSYANDTLLLKHASTNNGVSLNVVSEGDTTCNYTITKNDDNTFKLVANGRNLALYNTSNWRCYTSNSGIQKINLYKVTLSEVVVCSHSMTYHAEVPATCTEDGVIAYYECSLCNKKYKDEAGSEVAVDLVIDALGHDLQGNACSRCDWVYVQNYVIESGAQYYIVTNYNGTTYALNNGTYTEEVYAGGFAEGKSTAKEFSNLNELGAEQAWTFTQAGIDSYTISCGDVKLGANAKNNGLLTSENGGSFALSLGTDGQVYLSTKDSSGGVRYLTAYIPTNGTPNFRTYSDKYETPSTYGQYGQLILVKVPSHAFETAQAKASLQLDGTAEAVEKVNVRFGGVITSDMYSATAKYGVIVLPQAISNGAVPTKAQIEEYKTDKYAVECSPAEVEGGYQFAWVIDNLEANYANYSSKFYVYLYMVDGENVYVSQCSIYTVNGIIDAYLGDESVAADIKAVLETLKQADPAAEVPAE